MEVLDMQLFKILIVIGAATHNQLISLTHAGNFLSRALYLLIDILDNAHKQDCIFQWENPTKSNAVSTTKYWAFN